MQRNNIDTVLIALIAAITVFSCTVVAYQHGKRDAKVQVVAKCLQVNENKPLVEARRICEALVEM